MERVGRYQIRSGLGEGAMAKVFRAYDPDIDRELAIKVLKAQLRGDSEYHVRFLREAKGAGVLSHPNIVTVFDVGDEGGHPYIAMELIEGGTLEQVLDPKKLLPAKTVVEIGIQLVRALDYAHKKGIVHRDVKPANIMMIRDTTTIKVADFGICRIDQSEATQATQAGSVLGTPNYMSPEQVLGEKVDSRSDLFSAGVVLYQLLTGHLPFDGETLISVAYKITKTEPPSLDKLRPDLPLSLRRVVDRALKKQADKRFQTGEEFAAALIGVAKELQAEEEKKGKVRRIPLGVRWALMMAALVATTMTITAAFLYQQQYAAMLDQVKGYGGSLAKFMATQNAVPAALRGLGGDRRLHPGDDLPPGLQLHPGLRRQGRHPRQQHGRADQREIRAAQREAAVVERQGRQGAEPPDRRRARDPRLRRADPVPGQGDRRGARRHLPGAAQRGRQPRAGAAGHPHGGDQRGRRRRRLLSRGTRRRADPGDGQLARGTCQGPLRLPDRGQAHG